MKKRLLTIAGCMVLLGLALGGWLYYSLTHFSISFTPAQIRDMEIATKGSLGEAMFGNLKAAPANIKEGTGLDALLASDQSPKGEGLISAYQKDPEKFKRYAQLFDTALNGKRAGRFVQANRSSYTLPLSTSILPLGNEKLDAWGNPYCVIATKSGVAAVSRGEQARPSFDCTRDIAIKEIAAAGREIFQTSGGQVVVLVSEKDIAK